VLEVVQANIEAFNADVLIASDGPRVQADKPTLSLGARGAMNFSLTCNLREGGHHSGNWGGALADPAAILSHAIASIVSQTGANKSQRMVATTDPPICSRGACECSN